MVPRPKPAERRVTVSRIALITTSFPQNEEDLSGHFVLAHARALLRSGAEVHVVAPGKPHPKSLKYKAEQRENTSACDAFAASQVHVHWVRGRALFGFPGAMERLRQNPLRLVVAPAFFASTLVTLRNLAPLDRVVAHWMLPSAFPTALFTYGPLDVVVHGGDARLLVAAPAGFRTFVVKALLRRGARFQFVAAHLLEMLMEALPRSLAEQLLRASFVEPVPLEIPDVGSAASRLRASLDLSARDRLVVCAGRFVAEKRFDLALRATLLADDDVRLVMVGDGPEASRLRTIARACPRKIKFVGRLDRSSAVAWIAAADVVLHPSSNEGAPSVVREARAYGKRVVACAAGDVGRWAKTDSFITIAEPNERALCNALASALRVQK